MKALKKILKFLKLITVGVIWSYIYLYGSLLLFKSVWGFNYLSRSSWRLISDFWQSGGKIYSISDYIFVICLILFIPIWIYGWKKLYKTNFVALLISPILWFQNKSANKYLKKLNRIKILNIGISTSDEIIQDFENKLKKQKSAIENTPIASNNLRNNLKNKLSKNK